MPDRDAPAQKTTNSDKNPVEANSMTTSNQNSVEAMPTTNSDQSPIKAKPNKNQNTGILLSPEDVRPFVKAGPRNNKRKRVKGKSRILTDSPEKQKIMELSANRLKGQKQAAVVKNA